MKRIDYNIKEHGFVGHLSLPQKETTYGVIVIMGGEQSLLPRLYRLMPFIGIMYKSFGKHKAECLDAFEQSEKEIVRWIFTT